MCCGRLHAWWSAQSQLATLLSSLIARRWVWLQTLWWFRLEGLSVGGMVGAWCFGCLSGPPGFTCWISFAPVFGLVCCWVLILALSPCCVLVYVFWEMMRWWLGGLSCKLNICVSWSTSELRVRLAPLNRFKPSSKIFYWPFQGGTSFVDLLCFCSVLCLLCFVRVSLHVLRGHLLGKGWPLGSRLWCLLWVCHFPIGILGQVWYLIVSIPDLCNLTYFHVFLSLAHMVFWVRCGTWFYQTLIFAFFIYSGLAILRI